MKKKEFNLGRKLFLNKETIINLDEKSQGDVQGGNTTNPCWTSRPTMPCVICNPDPNPTQVINCTNVISKCICIGG